MAKSKKALEEMLIESGTPSVNGVVQKETYMTNLCEDVNFKIENEDMQRYAYQIVKNIEYTLKTDLNTLVALYGLKLCFSRPIYEEDNKTIKYWILDEKKTVNVKFDLYVQEFTYYELCKDLFKYEKKTIQAMNEFSHKFIKNIDNMKNLDFEVLENDKLNTNIEFSKFVPKYEFEIFNKLSFSKLLELNTLYLSQVQKLIDINVLTEYLTVFQIRNIVKIIRQKFRFSTYFTAGDFVVTEEEKEDKEEGEAPDFDLNNEKEYQLYDFKVYSKSKLTSIAYDCYTNYLRLKKQLAKKKTKDNGVI